MREQEARQVAADIADELMAMRDAPELDRVARGSARAFIGILRAYREYDEDLTSDVEQEGDAGP